MVKKGDIVVRKSYGGDLYFVVTDIDENNIVQLSCIWFRLCADAPVEDVQKVRKEKLFDFKRIFRSEVENRIEDILNERNTINRRSLNPGKVLHIDGDEHYLRLCLGYYKRLMVPVKGCLIPEANQSFSIGELLKEETPDIVILTGHDGICKEGDAFCNGDYATSSFFVDAVKKARQFRASKDDLVIFAGACQSDFEHIMEAGANFASSPERTMIHALDPVLLAEKISYTFFGDMISPEDVSMNTISGIRGIGGIDTRGTMRRGMPFSSGKNYIAKYNFFG